MSFRLLAFVVVLAVVAAVGVAFWRGGGPLPGRQSCTATVAGDSVTLDPEQSRNAALIAAIGIERGLPARAVSIALATAYQESKIRNIDYGDRDSLGLFQQRPSQGWGTAAQVQDPYYATNAFYDVLAQIEGFQSMRITEAAQRVQRSGFPEAYEDHAADARVLASALTGYSPGGAFTCTVADPGEERGTSRAVLRDLERAFGPVRTEAAARRDVALRVGGGEAGRRTGWAMAAYLVAHASQLQVREVAFDGKRWTAEDSAEGWTDDDARRTRVQVGMG